MDAKYRIKYRIILDGAGPLENKEIKIDKCMSSLHAKIRLEEYLKKKYINFKELIVTECKEEREYNPENLDELFSCFGDIFGSNFSNPFGKNNKPKK
jgi:hypothetical protein